MTIRLPQKTLADKILKIFGKERRLMVNDDVYEKYGQYVIVEARWEGFWKCLFRRRSSDQKLEEKALAEAQAEIEKWMADPDGKKPLLAKTA